MIFLPPQFLYNRVIEIVIMDKGCEKGEGEERSGEEKRREKGDELEEVRREEDEVREVERVRENEGTDGN